MQKLCTIKTLDKQGHQAQVCVYHHINAIDRNSEITMLHSSIAISMLPMPDSNETINKSHLTLLGLYELDVNIFVPITTKQESLF